MLSVVNFVITVGGSFVFAYKAVEYAMETPSFEMVQYLILQVISIIIIVCYVGLNVSICVNLWGEEGIYT